LNSTVLLKRNNYCIRLVTVLQDEEEEIKLEINVLKKVKYSFIVC